MSVQHLWLRQAGLRQVRGIGNESAAPETHLSNNPRRTVRAAFGTSCCRVDTNYKSLQSTQAEHQVPIRDCPLGKEQDIRALATPDIWRTRRTQLVCEVPAV